MRKLERPSVFNGIVADYLLRLEGALVARGGEILPGVVPILAALEREGIRPGLATGNFARGAQLKLAYFDLWEQFAGGGFGDGKLIRADVVREGLDAMSRHLGREVAPERCIVLGDTPLDIEAAHAVGARALAVATGSYTVQELQASDAEWVLADLSDTNLLLEILTS